MNFSVRFSLLCCVGTNCVTIVVQSQACLNYGSFFSQCNRCELDVMRGGFFPVALLSPLHCPWVQRFDFAFIERIQLIKSELIWPFYKFRSSTVCINILTAKDKFTKISHELSQKSSIVQLYLLFSKKRNLCF